ncbi:MAG: hypothetical protein ACKVXR_09495 [Planctomycetota bacterium]
MHLSPDSGGEAELVVPVQALRARRGGRESYDDGEIKEAKGCAPRDQRVIRAITT